MINKATTKDRQAYIKPESEDVELLLNASVLQTVSPGTGGGELGGDGDEFGD